MVSIIIVNYKAEQELLNCISSVLKSKPKVEFEIIVVNNDPASKLKRRLNEKFPQVKYFKSPGNIGYGAGNNLGAKHAFGEYLFILNPDTIVEKDSIDMLLNFIKKNPESGMVAPLLHDFSRKIYVSQGSDQYNLINAIITNSFINKLFPNSPISRKFFHKNWNKKSVEEFDVVPGTAFMIRKDLFKKVGMFDEKFFLYFEEYDLARRIKQLGYKNYIIPSAKVLHMWGESTKKRNDVDKIFAKSRYYFFRKNYGFFFTSIIDIISNLGKYKVVLLFTLIALIFLCAFKI
jgi:GT2 family glycosyltransferase